MFTGSWADAADGATSAATNATTHNRIPLSPPVRPLRPGKVTTTTGVCQSSYVYRNAKAASVIAFRAGKGLVHGRGRNGQGSIRTGRLVRGRSRTRGGCGDGGDGSGAGGRRPCRLRQRRGAVLFDECARNRVHARRAR